MCLTHITLRGSNSARSLRLFRERFKSKLVRAKREAKEEAAEGERRAVSNELDISLHSLGHISLDEEQGGSRVGPSSSMMCVSRWRCMTETNQSYA
jgi:hypothetical protein